MAANKSQLTLVSKFQESADDICHNLNFDTLFPKLLNPKLRFLSKKQLKSLHQSKKTHNDTYVARELLSILDQQPPVSTRRFIACLLMDDDHRGHEDIAKTLMNTIPSVEANRIRRLVASLADRSPERTSTSTTQGEGQAQLDFDPPWDTRDSNQLLGEDLVRRDVELQYIFRSGDVTVLLRDDGDKQRFKSAERGILEALYYGLALMRRGIDVHKDSIAELFIELLMKCRELDSGSPNRDTLTRRVYWAQSQMYRALQLDDLAFHSASLAEGPGIPGVSGR